MPKYRRQSGWAVAGCGVSEIGNVATWSLAEAELCAAEVMTVAAVLAGAPAADLLGAQKCAVLFAAAVVVPQRLVHCGLAEHVGWLSAAGGFAALVATCAAGFCVLRAIEEGFPAQRAESRLKQRDDLHAQS